MPDKLWGFVQYDLEEEGDLTHAVKLGVQNFKNVRKFCNFVYVFDKSDKLKRA